MSVLTKASATGNIVTGSGQLHSIILTPGSTASSVDVRLDGSGGSVVASLQAAANGSSVAWRAVGRARGVAGNGVRFPGPLHLTLAGTGASVTVETS
jgi:hypothetical protein